MKELNCILSLDQYWEIDSFGIDGLLEQTAEYIGRITTKGMSATLQDVLR